MTTTRTTYQCSTVTVTIPGKSCICPCLDEKFITRFEPNFRTFWRYSIVNYPTGRRGHICYAECSQDLTLSGPDSVPDSGHDAVTPVRQISHFRLTTTSIQSNYYSEIPFQVFGSPAKLQTPGNGWPECGLILIPERHLLSGKGPGPVLFVRIPGTVPQWYLLIICLDRRIWPKIAADEQENQGTTHRSRPTFRSPQISRPFLVQFTPPSTLYNHSWHVILVQILIFREMKKKLFVTPAGYGYAASEFDSRHDRSMGPAESKCITITL